MATFTVSVLAMFPPADFIDPITLSRTLSFVLLGVGFVDAAVTCTTHDISFTSQIEAFDVGEAANAATKAMYLAGITRITSVHTVMEETHEPSLAVHLAEAG